MVKNNCYFVKMSSRTIMRYFLIAGILCLVFGVFLTLVVPKIVESKITEQTRLINNSETFHKWKYPDLPIFIRFYFYNVTNPNEILEGGKPIFQEVGPIVYQEQRRKEVDAIDTEKDTVTFRQSITYSFKPNLSSLSEDDVITVINIPLVGISKQGLSTGIASGALREALHEYMDYHPGEVKVFIQKKMKELLFQGYYDALLEDLAQLAGRDLMPNHTFGLYVNKNGTLGSSLTIDAGVKDFRNFGKIISVNGETEMSQWDDEYCNRLNGSDGSLYPPFLTKNSVIRMFGEDACRSVFMTFQKEVDYFGISAFRFHLPPQFWASGDSYPDNMCFCPNKNKCGRSGVMDISPCQKGAPVFASLPHFLYGDQDLWNNSGLFPSVERDETYIDIEPTTGLLVGVMKRFQVNLDLFPNKKVRGFRKVPSMIFPVLWGEEFFISTEERTDMLYEKLFKPLKIVTCLTWMSFIIGFLLIFSTSVSVLLLLKNKKDEVKSSEILKVLHTNTPGPR